MRKWDIKVMSHCGGTASYDSWKALTTPVELEGMMFGVNPDGDGPHGGHSLHKEIFTWWDFHKAHDFSSRIFRIVPAGSVLWKTEVKKKNKTWLLLSTSWGPWARTLLGSAAIHTGDSAHAAEGLQASVFIKFHMTWWAGRFQWLVETSSCTVNDNP